MQPASQQVPTALPPQPWRHRPPWPSLHSPTALPLQPQPHWSPGPSLYNRREAQFLLWFCAHLATCILWGPSLQCSCPRPQLLHVSLSVLVRSLSSSQCPPFPVHRPSCGTTLGQRGAPKSPVWCSHPRQLLVLLLQLSLQLPEVLLSVAMSLFSLEVGMGRCSLYIILPPAQTLHPMLPGATGVFGN